MKKVITKNIHRIILISPNESCNGCIFLDVIDNYNCIKPSKFQTCSEPDRNYIFKYSLKKTLKAL